MSVFNGEKTLKRCIDSILNQSFSDFEFIIINDGSTDSTEDLLHDYKDSRLLIVDLDHVGLAKALNYGLSLCKGEYIARMDADDWCHKDRLQKQVKYLVTYPNTDVVSCLVNYAGKSSLNKGYALHVDWINSLTAHKQMYNKRFQDAPLANPSCMFRKSLVDNYGMYSELEIPEDYEFWLRLFHEGVNFGKVDETLFYWSDLPERITRTNSNYSQDKFFEVKTHYLAKWINEYFESLPKLFVIGTGKQVRKRSKLLESHGLSVYKYVDVKPSGNDKIIHISQLPLPSENVLVLSYIGDRKGKQGLAEHMHLLGYEGGRNFVFMY